MSSPKPLGVGFVLHPDTAYLNRYRGIIEDEAEFFELAPETLWAEADDGRLTPGSRADLLEQIRDRSGKPLVAHGVGLSLGSACGDPAGEARLARWLSQITQEQQRFGFLWYTEHLGWIEAGEREVVLPLPLPPTDEAIKTVAQRLARLKPIVPVVGIENQVSYFTFGNILDEPRFWTRICTVADAWLLLDLHNGWTQCLNYGVPFEDYLSGVDLSRVLEIHLAGGSDSEPGWLPSGRVLRLDSHDGPVPEPVWEAFARLRPLCPNLRGVVVERGDAAVTDDEVRHLRDEVCRARRIFWES
jgi:uncharacterized protein